MAQFFGFGWHLCAAAIFYAVMLIVMAHMWGVHALYAGLGIVIYLGLLALFFRYLLGRPGSRRPHGRRFS